MEALERLGFTGFVSNKSFLPFVFGAGEGDRTLATGLEGRGSTTELHPQVDYFFMPVILWWWRVDSNH